jgi:hypothetical protein
VTSVIGQNAERGIEGIWCNRNRTASLKTLVKEYAKGLIAGMGSTKYQMHRMNQVVRKTTLRDGHPVSEFMRCNPHYMGVSSGETAAGIAEVLVPRVLDRLVRNKGVCILYTHLGKISDPARPFPPSTVGAFQRLSGYFLDGHILVTTTRRLLGYCTLVSTITVSSRRENGYFEVQVETQSAGDLDGLTLYTPNPERTVVKINGTVVDRLRCNPADKTGQRSVSLPWRKLEFPGV